MWTHGHLSPKLKTDVGSATMLHKGGELFLDAARKWDADVAVIKEASAPVPRSGINLFLIFVGPYILCIAIAAQIVKICYEKRD